MPSPMGHALAGVAAGWMVAPPRSRKDALMRGAVPVAAMAPDLDLFASVHRGPTHSLAAASPRSADVDRFSRDDLARPGRAARERKDTWQS